ncbi:hypothetical protein CHLRE_02g077451v5 [Chlamydomonas reinhardtii]|uniref:AB hydrolase-1 domain-containing protein n=1 Tax=Chlamydomonas reinhardtii TaxID=3055 RepID=A0A2K3E0A5_CHLRE|nr:uncharacterized protein CHLRE_02g077451v5 [Chlamydomonas reinhardtii]PNW86213.1 hypothetical protein CHLRE_02g077451v5 [Chlamydomonas reinhardtii]
MTGSWFTRWFSSEPAAGSTAAAASAASDTQDAPKGCFSHSYKDAHAHQYSQTVAVDACAGSTAAAADAALRTSAAQTAAHATRLRQHAPRLAHEVLNNGQAIKHTARHAGHAVAADGTRLYVDVYEVGASDGSRNAAALGDTAAGPAQADCASAAVDEDGVANVLCIMGFAAGRDGWLPIVHHWTQQAGSELLHRISRVRFAVYDNRGIGDSDSPEPRAAYSTAVMAADAVAVLDHLGWQRAHVVGFSMGGMVALKLGAAAPQRLHSLTALSVTGGGWQIIPTKWRALKLLLWAAMARTPHQRAHADVHFHFSRDTLLAQVEAATLGSDDSKTPAAHGMAAAAAAQARRVEEALVDEYVATSQMGAPQPHCGLVGQLHAVWNHSLTAAEQHRVSELVADGVPVKLVHGSHDLMAHWQYGERTAKQLRAAFILIDGGHFIARECAATVCMHLADSIVASGAVGSAAADPAKPQPHVLRPVLLGAGVSDDTAAQVALDAAGAATAAPPAVGAMTSCQALPST